MRLKKSALYERSCHDSREKKRTGMTMPWPANQNHPHRVFYWEPWNTAKAHKKRRSKERLFEKLYDAAICPWRP